MQAYFIAMLVMTSYMAVIWSTNGILNTLLKLTWFGLSGWSAFFLLQAFGYIVKA